METYDYIAIDFETANASLTSACSVGLIFCNNGKIVLEKYYLINPNEPFLEGNIKIHGITPDMVTNEKTFDKLWPEIKELIDGNILVAHASEFDLSVLRALLIKYNLSFPNIKIGCTLKASRIALKDKIPNFKLNSISQFLNCKHNHHNALSDAYVCACFIEYAKRMYNSISINELFDYLGLGFGVLNETTYRKCFRVVGAIDTKIIKTNRLEGKIVAFTGKPKLCTKNELKKIIKENSGFYSKGVISAIDMFIILQNPVKKEIEIVNRIKENKTVMVLTEEEFIGYINGK